MTSKHRYSLLLRDLCIVLPLCLSLLSLVRPYNRPSCTETLRCLVAGYPIWFISDAGYSPTASWGKIDGTDLLESNHPDRFFLNYGFYALLLWPAAWLVQRRLTNTDPPLRERGA